MKPTIKKGLLQAGGFVTSIAPLVATVIVKWDSYTSTPTRTVSLGVGGVMAVILILIKTLNKIPKGTKPIIGYAIAFALVAMLEPLILDLKLLLGMALIGEGLDVAIFSWQISKVQKVIDAQVVTDQMSAGMDAQTKAITAAITQALGGGKQEAAPTETPAPQDNNDYLGRV